MSGYKYRSVALPRGHPEVKKRRRPPGEYLAAVLEAVINDQAAEGWEYLRAETITAIARKSMLSAKSETAHTLLVFRKSTRPAAAIEPDFLDEIDKGPQFEPEIKIAGPITLDDEPGPRRFDD